MTEEIITSENNQKLAVYCDTCICQNCKRLEQENKELCEDNTRLGNNLDYINEELDKYKSAFEEIRAILNKECGIISNAKVVGLINEVLNESC